MYQVLTHALSDKSNKTKFTLLFSNVSEKDILLREEFDTLAKKYPETFKVVYYIDKGDKDWKGKPMLLRSFRAYPVLKHVLGETGYISKESIQKYIEGPDAGNKVKIFVCGMFTFDQDFRFAF